MVIFRSVTSRGYSGNNLVIRFWFIQPRLCVCVCGSGSIVCILFLSRGVWSLIFWRICLLRDWEQALFCGGGTARVPLTWGFPQACWNHASCVCVLTIALWGLCHHFSFSILVFVLPLFLDCLSLDCAVINNIMCFRAVIWHGMGIAVNVIHVRLCQFPHMSSNHVLTGKPWTT